MKPVCYDGQYKIYTNYTDTVVAVIPYQGKVIRGIATCNLAEDTFSFDTGKEIAIAKCEIAIAKKDRASALQQASAKKEQADDLHYQYCTACLAYENAIDHFIEIDDTLIKARNKLSSILESL